MRKIYIIAVLFALCGSLFAPARPHGLQDRIAYYETKYGIPRRLLCAVISVESGFRRNATSHDVRVLSKRSWAKDVIKTHRLDVDEPGTFDSFGLTQISYLCAVDLGYRGQPIGLYNVETNLKYGAKRLRQCLRSSGGSVSKALWRYNQSRQYVKDVLSEWDVRSFR